VDPVAHSCTARDCHHNVSGLIAGPIASNGRIVPMPGTNLTREEAATRAALLDVTSYTIDLDLTTGDKTFESTTTLRFTCREPGAETFADLVGAIIHEITLNGEPMDEASSYQNSRIRLTNLQAENELVVRADCAYSHSGEGLHRFVDPVDGRVYLYTQFEVPDARRVFTTFEQPDLKSVYTWTVVAPVGWKVVSNAPTPTPEPIDGDKARWSFPESKRMSTYVTALVAGEYHEHVDSYEGKNGTIPLGHYCRQALVEHLDVDELLLLTKQGFEFFEEAFDFPYPFEKYDQLYVPEYNSGAMENAGAITIRDEYLPRSRQDSAFYEFRCSVILHEMAHMWFGDLVTMRWWDDLWLNESFAEWACYHAAVENTSYTESSTHPIAADNYDLIAVEVNFDGITYAKGASVLKQLVAWVGLDAFMVGLRRYFKDHAYDNSEFVDLLTALEAASGRELDAWAKEWLQTSGVNTLYPEFELTTQGSYSSFGVRQTTVGDNQTLRRHRLGIGLYDEKDGHLVRRRKVEVDIEGELTSIDELVGEDQPDLLLLNDGDLTYAKIRLDERSLATLVRGLRTLDDSLARALCWGAAWDMTRDAEMSATDYVTLVLQNIGSETDAFGIRAIPNYAALAVNLYSDPARRPDLRATWEAGLRELLHAAEPGSNAQLIFVRAYAGALVSDDGKAEVAGLLDGSVTIDGLDIDTDLRWVLLVGLAKAGVVDEDRIDEELDRDRTISGQENAAAARASRPDAGAKERAWTDLADNPDVPNETHRSIALAFMRHGQEELLAPYVERYLAAADTVWEKLGTHMATNLLEDAFPLPLASPELLDRLDRWLEESAATAAAKRYVREGRADIARALTAQALDRSAERVVT
jgi:aminopeptidase N